MMRIVVHYDNQLLPWIHWYKDDRIVIPSKILKLAKIKDMTHIERIELQSTIPMSRKYLNLLKDMSVRDYNLSKAKSPYMVQATRNIIAIVDGTTSRDEVVNIVYYSRQNANT